MPAVLKRASRRGEEWIKIQAGMSNAATCAPIVQGKVQRRSMPGIVTAAHEKPQLAQGRPLLSPGRVFLGSTRRAAPALPFVDDSRNLGDALLFAIVPFVPARAMDHA